MNQPIKNDGLSFAQRGFTLVEMSIVLVIIGVILGAVAIGTGLQRDAEQKRIKQTFIDPWVQAYNSYYQRSGVVLGDSQTEPRLMVNGTAYAGTDRVSGGDMSAVTPPGAVCHGAAGQQMARATTPAPDLDLLNHFRRMGVTLPSGRAAGMEDRYLYLDSNGNPQEIQICFQWNTPGTRSGSGNVMVITGLTPDMARALDQMVDGVANARQGVFRQEGVVDTGTGALEWSVDNTEGIDGETDILDDAQVAVVVAHYTMNQ